MAEERVQRRLAAILFTDLVGSTELMARSEEAGLRAKRRHRQLVREQVERFRGDFIEAPGDETLSIFHSALDAVSCALGIEAVDRSLVDHPPDEKAGLLTIGPGPHRLRRLHGCERIQQGGQARLDVLAHCVALGSRLDDLGRHPLGGSLHDVLGHITVNPADVSEKVVHSPIGTGRNDLIEVDGGLEQAPTVGGDRRKSRFWVHQMSSVARRGPIAASTARQ